MVKRHVEGREFQREETVGAGKGRVDHPVQLKIGFQGGFIEVLGTLKWGIMCMTMLDIFESGVDRRVERAAIGRRASEAEIDLLNLLAPGG